MTTLSADDPDEDFGRQLTTLPGWREFVGASLSEPMAALTKAEYDALEAESQDAYDDDRLDHHARLQVVATSTVRSTVTCGRRLIILNRGAISARRGLIVSGPANTGKTIALTQLGLAHELQDRRRHPGQDDRIPVIYITVPPAATPRMIAAEFARFLGLPVLRRSNITDLTEAVVGVCTKARTGVILVDEIHNISLMTRHGAEASDTLKYFSERIPATFAYAGIDVESGSLLSGTRGDQIAARFTPMATHPFPYNSEWKALVAQMEANLVLHEHKRGTLTRLDRFIHTRTGGMIGTLSHQIRGAAVDAILGRTEKINKAGLLAVDLDIASRRKRPDTDR
ncbi:MULTISPECIES: ATP-binding protein [unclassified Streptomyces]|uniref:ATP-binding protein n=1 Tax=unclassified Streptomyces TaxID=2593676 RepID=UPI00225A4AE8|nr:MULTISPECIES: ATP-binding protein [unclassified Streptomyces]MCX4402202.1 TniB family NTP-binding protein [Streptomyces sp. NBC_01764]MCX5183140.1 TniB family NTP-binding protein [Streptomyces sp. NBC_00268]